MVLIEEKLNVKSTKVKSTKVKSTKVKSTKVRLNAQKRDKDEEDVLENVINAFSLSSLQIVQHRIQPHILLSSYEFYRFYFS